MSLIRKYWWIVAILVVVILYFGYTNRHAIKVMLGMAPATPAVQTTGTSSAAPTNNIYTTRTDPVKGDYLADFQGTSLYVFDNDLASGKSTCYDTCAQKWPAYSSGATAQGQLPVNITVMTRTDGSTQFAWMGRPLYYYAPDQNPGDVLGDGIGGTWHLVKP